MALLTGLSCAELSSLFPKAEVEYNYVTNTFNARLAFVIGLLVFVSGVITAATVALGFAGYFSALTSFPMIFSAIVLLIVSGGAGTRFSAHEVRDRVHVYHRILCIEECLISHS
jgi:amino acid transporter